jgi:hypothetical protein
VRAIIRRDGRIILWCFGRRGGGFVVVVAMVLVWMKDERC